MRPSIPPASDAPTSDDTATRRHGDGDDRERSTPAGAAIIVDALDRFGSAARGEDREPLTGAAPESDHLGRSRGNATPGLPTIEVE